MPRRQHDRVRVESAGGRFDAFEALEVTNDIAGISEATFTVGDDGAITEELEELVAPGQPFKVYCNDTLRLTGRAEINQIPGNADSGVVLNLTVRTKTSDARVASANPDINVQNTSIKEFILACYKPLGLTESDFVFGQFADRDLISGKAGGAAPPLDLEKIQVAQAKAQPPETIYEAVERHLKRYKATHWDGPDGTIIVGTPDDSQAPLYRLQASREPSRSKGNNIVSYQRTKDWSELASRITIIGAGGATQSVQKRFRGWAADEEVEAVASSLGHFNRTVLVPDQLSQEKSAAERAAMRELSARRRRKDAWEFVVDGWSYWDGATQFGWATNATVDVDVDQVGGARGRYLIVRVQMRLDTSGASTSITVVAPGIWVL